MSKKADKNKNTTKKSKPIESRPARNTPSHTGGADRVNLLKYLSTFASKNAADWPKGSDLFNNLDQIFGHDRDRESWSLTAFKTWLKTSISDIALHQSNYGFCNIQAYCKNTNQYFVASEETGKMEAVSGNKETAAGKTLLYSVTEPFKEIGLPFKTGRMTLWRLLFLRDIAGKLRLPNIFDATEGLDALTRQFGARKGSNPVPINPFILEDEVTKRVPCRFLQVKRDGYSIARDSDELTQSVNDIYEQANRAYMSGMKFEFDYANNKGACSKVVCDIICAVLAIKNGAMYLMCVPGCKENHLQLESNNRGLAGTAGYAIRSYKFDRMSQPVVSTVKSTLTVTELADLAKMVSTNDGIYYCHPDERFDAVIKVGPGYVHYFEESMPFNQANKLNESSLAEFNQPSGATCYRIKGTNQQHLSNEVAKSRGNLVVIYPPQAIDFIRDDLRKALECQTQLEPMFLADITSQPDYKRDINARNLIATGPALQHPQSPLLSALPEPLNADGASQLYDDASA